MKNATNQHVITDIVVVLDRSGSMQSIARETISGFNAFLREQQAVKGAARITLVQFDHEYEKVYDMVDIHQAVPLNDDTYMPRGTTALLDAMGRTIRSTRRRLASMPESQQPGRVIFVTITDGHENHSRKYSRSQVFDSITKMQKKHRWEFLFLGANQDAIEEAAHLGIKAGKAMNFVADSQGTEMMFCYISNKLACCRESGEEVDFEDR